MQSKGVTRDEIVEAARGWLDTRWVHQGRSTAGIDCAGLLIKVHEDLGLPVEDMTGYRRSPDGVSFRRHIFNQTTHTNDLLPGTICLFREALFPTHTGFLTMKHDRLHLIHAYATAGKVVEEPFDHEWPQLLVSTRNIIGLID
jgi:hypothetical protein